MTFDLDRRRLLTGGCALAATALAGCSDTDNGHTTYEITNERSSDVLVDFRVYTNSELVLAQEYELGAGASRREENVLAGVEYDIEMNVESEASTYELERNGCEDQELRIRIGEDAVEFDADNCE
ncbi:hypothetical protein ACFQH2_14135 [Natronoarchaeum sp. GCM10025703]|uniref:hypothetical protein n=1 Tax=unclassified Natronoarchaeum TaxID=2620183 RepID=UPI0036222184